MMLNYPGQSNTKQKERTAEKCLQVEWAKKWQMYVNIDKCEAMHLVKSNLNCVYTVLGAELAIKTQDRVLGVTVDYSLKTSIYCTASNTANKMLGIIKNRIEKKTQKIIMQINCVPAS